MELRRAVLCAAFALAARPAAAQEPPLATVLQRAGSYVADFQRRLSTIVAEERYTQTMTPPLTRMSKIPPARRELRSDLLLVKPEGGGWLQFRDVFEVDGLSVRDRDERLVKLFLEPPASLAAQTRQILRESARYNIGSIQRTLNTPVLALQFLDARNQGRVRFRPAKDRRPDVARSAEHFAVGNDVVVLQFEETQRGTMIRTTDGEDLFAKGRFWIERESGRVLMTEIDVTTRVAHAVVDVSYQAAPLLDLLAPAEMRERYDAINGEHIDGVATYGR
jgi:hypothetical protein